MTTFDEWWAERQRVLGKSARLEADGYHIASAAWEAATAGERERCRLILGRAMLDAGEADDRGAWNALVAVADATLRPAAVASAGGMTPASTRPQG